MRSKRPPPQLRDFLMSGTASFRKSSARLRHPNFRLFWSGNFLSNIGTWMQNVAQGWLVLSLTNSAFWLGVVGFAGSIPFLVFTLFGGVIADRVNKRKLLLVTQSAMMVLAFALAALELAQESSRCGRWWCSPSSTAWPWP